jgi:hypothetical protein
MDFFLIHELITKLFKPRIYERLTWHTSERFQHVWVPHAAPSNLNVDHPVAGAGEIQHGLCPVFTRSGYAPRQAAKCRATRRQRLCRRG